MLDLDGLKAANDRFGHEWGDHLLKAVADVLHGDVRVTDIPARYGGDEFVLMLPETDLNGGILVAEKVRVDIARIALPHNGAVVRTSASIGIVTFPEDGRSSAELMRRADLAMYEAKRRGRDQVVRFARGGPAALPVQPGIVAPPSGAPSSARLNYRYPATNAGPDSNGLAPPGSLAAHPAQRAEPLQMHIPPSTPAADTAAGQAVQPGVAVGPGRGTQELLTVPIASAGPAPWETR
jgi:diguanylate cyclase (GGDEF)-like protein